MHWNDMNHKFINFKVTQVMMQLRGSVIVVLCGMCVGFSVCQRGAAAVLGHILQCPSPLGQSSDRTALGCAAAQGSLSRWLLWGAPAPSPRASKGQKKTKGNLSLLFHLKCRAGSLNPSSCLGGAGVSMSAHSRRLLLSCCALSREDF